MVIAEWPWSHFVPSENRSISRISSSASVKAWSSLRKNPSFSSVNEESESRGASASSNIIRTPSRCQSANVVEMSPPECHMPDENSIICPIAGTGSSRSFEILPAIARSSTCKPLRFLESNQILRAGPGPPIRCRVMWQSSLIPCDRNNALLTARTNTSILPQAPDRSFRFNFPLERALCPIIAKRRCISRPQILHIVEIPRFHHLTHLL